jgi:sulfide:quinone oxidoreductase
MAARASSRGQTRILIAGGGFAAVEAVLALRALGGNRVALAMLSPEPVFHYRPAATREPFDQGPSRRYDLRAIADEMHADYHQARLEAVASRHHSIRTASGARLGYDRLILAIGARAVVGVAGAVAFRDQRDIALIRRLLGEVQDGAVSRIAFALPAVSTWPLPLYELALLSARYAREHGLKIESVLVTPERQPLEIFGPEVSVAIRAVLERSGVGFVGNAVPSAARRDGSLALAGGEVIEADRVVALPELRGRRLSGVPAGRLGFVPVDRAGRVEGLQDVYAAGDVTAFPVKQGGLAAQQADVAAQAIAEDLGAPIKALRPARVLQARLLGAERPVFLRAELDWTGQPTKSAAVHGDDEHGVNVPKVLGRYLAPYLETREPLPDEAAA